MIYSLAIIVYLVAAVVVTRIPYVRTYLSICYTLLHEVIRLLISGGKSKGIRLRKNDSTLEMTDSVTFKDNLISYVSYTAMSLVAIGLFYIVSTNSYHLILFIFIGLTAVSIVFWIRQFLEILWALSFIALLAISIYLGYGVAKPTAIFLASYILVKSILNALYLCRDSLVNRTRKGIVENLKWIPSMMLGFVLLGQSLYTGFFIVRNFVFYT